MNKEGMYNLLHKQHQKVPNRNSNNERYIYTRQDIRDRLSKSAQHRQKSYVQENRPVTNTERNRPLLRVDQERARENIPQYSPLTNFLPST